MNAGPRNGQDPEARAVQGLVDGPEARGERRRAGFDHTAKFSRT